ncbi:MAG TPA: lysophospholipase [Spirochaetia bacterium]|nr:lysophospholipase [Spirochaetia bacterium]
MEHREGTFQGADGLELYCQAWRPAGEARAVAAFVHGFGEHSGRHPNLVTSLTSRGIALHSFDLRGHGQSPGQRGFIRSWSELREDVERFLATVQKNEGGLPLFLIGLSMGGLIVLNYVLHRPQGLRGVVAMAPAVGQLGVASWKMALGRFLSRVWPRFSINPGLETGGISRDPEVVRIAQEDPLAHSKGTARLAEEMSRAIEWTRAHAGEIKLPLLILHGGADRIVNPEASRSFFEKVSFPDRERREFEGGYHELDNDVDHGQVLGYLADWLEARI